MFGNEAHFVPVVIKKCRSGQARPDQADCVVRRSPIASALLAGAATAPGPAATAAAGTARAASPAAAATGAAATSAAAPPQGNLVTQLWLCGVLLVEDVERRQADVGNLFLAEEELLTWRSVLGR